MLKYHAKVSILIIISCSLLFSKNFYKTRRNKKAGMSIDKIEALPTGSFEKNIYQYTRFG
ncbi:MAG: hypothetical protein LUF33_04450 [Clostridiales bacterium]|nr:hypothetical protein [Clostridiales bacterium]